MSELQTPAQRGAETRARNKALREQKDADNFSALAGAIMGERQATPAENPSTTFETFYAIDHATIRSLQRDAPYICAGSVSYRKYRVTVELIDEPKSILAERLEDMWANTTNCHHAEALHKAAKAIGIKLQLPYGKRKK